jgi:methylmalonyl-CoA mutase N-terminal domain/subunit
VKRLNQPRKASRNEKRFQTFHWKKSIDFTLRLTSSHSISLATFPFPGEFPYTRGIHPTGYRGKLWTMRQFAGFSTPEETNARFQVSYSTGQTGFQ